MSAPRGSTRRCARRPNRHGRTLLIVELTGLAGIGKSHLRASLQAALGPRLVVVENVRLGLRDLARLPAIALRLAPLMAYLVRRSKRDARTTFRFARQLLQHAWREEVAIGRPGSAAIALAEEGWFHKLRAMRRLLYGDLAYDDLPASARRWFVSPRLVVLLTCDASVVCARRLARRGQAVTAESLSIEQAAIQSRGAWQEVEFTRRDLAQAGAADGLRFVEVEYLDGYDVNDELLPRILAMASALPVD